MNSTLAKFGHPASLICSYRHWCVLLRPSQMTLGALVLGSTSEATAFSQLEPEAFAEMHGVIGGIEANLKAFRPYSRINYLMLMMVDPHVHFHVLPRYDSPQVFVDLTFADAGWPGPPHLKSATTMTDSQFQSLAEALRSQWRKG